MSPLETWATEHRIHPESLAALREILAAPANPPASVAVTGSEPRAQAEIRLAASGRGMRLWRNNVGAVTTDDGRHIRYGLANESMAMNRVIKSADLIGITPVDITQAHVGRRFGMFTSIEVKRPGWRYRGQGREVAQLAWANAIISLGGWASFATGPEAIDTLDNSG